MADLPSILGGMAQGFLDFGKSAVDLFGTGGASIADLIESARTGKVTTRNSDDFRKWLYDTNDVKDAAAKGLGTALNGVQTVSDYIPGIGAVTRNPLFNAGQGAIGGLADEFKMYGKDYDLGRAGQRAAVGAGGALASTGLADALKSSGNALLKSGTAQGLARGAVGGAIGAGGYTAIDGGSLGDVANSALQGAGMGAALGGTMGALQDFKPAKTYNMALTDDERQARIANAKDMLDDAKYTIMSATPEDGIDIVAANDRVMELRKYINALENGYDSVRDYDAAIAKQAQDVASKATNEVAPESLGSTLANADMAVNTAKLTPEQEEFFKDSVLRDENGKLMRVYHSSPNKFTTFDDSKLGENTAYLNTAFGHFVTPDADFSSRFMDIDNKGTKGNTMELYANVKKPITHPYNADYKYKGADLDNIVENYFKATDGLENLNFLKQAAKDNGTSLYEAYVDNMDIDSDPFETAQWDREALMKNGYDAVELVEGLKSGLVNGSTDNTPISSYAIFSGNQLKDINNLAPTDAPDIMASRMKPGEPNLGRTLANQDLSVNSAPETAAVIAGKNRGWDELYDMLSKDAGAFENEDRTPITASPSQLRSEIQAIDAKYPNDMPDDIWDKRYGLNQQLKAAEKGYNSPYDYYVGESKKNFRQDFESRPDKYKSKIADIESRAQRQAALDQDIANASPRKLAQFNLIQQKNPAPNETLTWIRSPKDILTWDEAIAGAEGDNAFTWPDYTLEDALRDQKKHSMTVYSSYPIKGGTFVTPSRQQASDYAGGGRVYSKVIRPDDVAWINGDEGQYAYTRKK